MISETILTYIIIIVLINCFESRLIPQLLLLTLIIYTIYNYTLDGFVPIDIILIGITLLYCLSHIINSFEQKEDD